MCTHFLHFLVDNERMKTMPNSTQEERLRWITPILKHQVSIKIMSEVCPFSARSLKYWLKQYRELGAIGLANHSTRPKTEPNETPIYIKEKIVAMRKEYDLSALKLSWQLEKQDIAIHPRTIGKILKANHLTRKYRQRKPYPPKTKTQFLAGELIEIDIKYVPSKLAGQRYYQFTAIDCASRWRYMKVLDDFGNRASVDFLNQLVQISPFLIKAIKTDNGANFTNRYTGYMKSTDPRNSRLHPFDLECQKLDIIHYLIDPGKPAQNGRVERSHRSDQESFYAKIKYRTREELCYQIRLWNMFYNNLEHCGLNGLTPNEYLKLNQTKVQNVRT